MRARAHTHTHSNGMHTWVARITISVERLVSHIVAKGPASMHTTDVCVSEIDSNAQRGQVPWQLVCCCAGLMLARAVVSHPKYIVVG